MGADSPSTWRHKVLKPWVVMPLVALIALGGWYLLRGKDDNSTVSTAAAADMEVEATSATMAQTVSADGTVAAAQTDDLSFASAGTVTAVNVAAGDKVTAGQVLATIDSAELQADVTDAEANLADAQAALSDDTDADASEAQIEADQTAVTTAQDNLDTANEALAGAQLVATFNGTVASVDLTVGEQLTSGGSGGTTATGSQSGSGGSASTLGSSSQSGGPNQQTSASSGSSSSSAQIQVISSGSYTVDVSLDDTDISKVKVGQVASLSLSTSTSSSTRGGFPGGGFPGGGFPGASANTNQSSGSNATTTTTPATTSTEDSVKGLVTEVGKVADASSGVASYPVTIAFNDDSGKFNVGATVTADITYAESKNTVQVPTRAVTTSNGTSTVTVVGSDGKQETRTVTTGLTSGAMVEIASGLKAGEKVVITLPGRPGGTGNTGSNGNAGGSGSAGGGSGGFTPPEGGGFPGQGGGS